MSSLLSGWLGWALGALAAVGVFIAVVIGLQSMTEDETLVATRPQITTTQFMDGAASISGSAMPGSTIEVQVDGATVATTETNDGGDFAIVFDLPPSEAARSLRVAALNDAGEPVYSDVLTLAPAPAEEPAAVEQTDVAPEPEAAAPEEAPQEEVAVAPAPSEPENAETMESAGPEPLAPPVFDTIRFPADGIAVVAGFGDAGSEVVIFLDGTEVARELVNSAGDFAALFDLKMSDAPRIVRLAATRGGEDLVYAEESRIVEPRQPVIAAVEPQTQPQAPQAEPQEELPEPQAVLPEPETPTPDETPEVAAPVQPAEVPQMDGTPETDMAAAPEVPALEETPTTVPAPLAPRVLRADRDGIRVEDEPGMAGEPSLSLDTISYDGTGAAIVAGRAAPNARVRLYLDNSLVSEAPVEADGQWSVTLPDSVKAGVYTLRVDQIDPDGGVTARVESPFKREDREVLATALGITSEPERPVEVPDAGTDSPAPERVSEPAQDASAVPAPDVAPVPEKPNATPTGQAEAPAAPEPVEDTSPTMASATQDAPKAPEKPGSDPIIAAVTVQPGSTLWAIAQDRYGEGLLYVQVFEANRDKIRDPDLIYPGQVFDLPATAPAAE